MNNLNLVGRITKDAELKHLKSTGTPIVNFTIAVDRDYKKNNKTVTDFIPVTTMGNHCEKLVNYLSKGTLVSVNGSLNIDEYQDKDGNKKSFAKCSATKIELLSKPQQTKALNPKGFEAIDNDDLPF